jgi:hypothetical protein
MIVQMGHDVCEILKNCFLTAEHISPFYGKTVRVTDFFTFLDFSTFQTIYSALYGNDPNCNRLWKLRHIFNLLNGTYSEYYAPFVHLTLDEIIVLNRGRIIFKHYMPKGHVSE